MHRRWFLLSALALGACQTTSQPPEALEVDPASFRTVENAAALMAIVRGRTVVYTDQSSKGAGIRQTFNEDGTTIYGDQKRRWTVRNGQYCSSANLTSDPSTWPCFKVDVDTQGRIIRWQRPASSPQNEVPGVSDIWYGRIV